MLLSVCLLPKAYGGRKRLQIIRTKHARHIQNAALLLQWLDETDAQTAYERELRSLCAGSDTIIPRGAVSVKTDGVDGFSYYRVCGAAWNFIYFVVGEGGCVRAEVCAPDDAQDHSARLLAFLATLTYAE